MEDSGEKVNYLNMTIWCEWDTKVEWHSKVYDKTIGVYI